ncbi:MAG TPA: 4-hydroxy-tetrahydrodipicolinate reductase [Candidatus Nitrosotalea sp.]|nr:4-hydroxy-tetrahydrodipicolinate reductase [Candidatus Nitrosotalea sp.]
MAEEITPGPIKIGIAGALGRMGQALTAFSIGRDDVVLAALCHRPASEGTKINLPGQQSDVLVSMAEALAQAEVMLDFTAPEATVALVEASVAMAKKPALVIGTTGLSATQQAAIAGAARYLTIVQSGNFSLGVNMLMGLVEQAARRLAADDWDIEILEAHHRRKVDAPSGTALMLGEAAAAGRGVDLAAVTERGRDGITGPRKEGAIGFSALRGGGIIGEHSVIFAAEDETLTLSHAAHDRALFCRGAIAAACWAARCAKPGLYSMMDVLGFTPTV